MDNEHIITSEEHRKWFHGLDNNNSAMEFIFDYQGMPIGQLSISRIDYKNGTAYWGYSRGEKKAPSGAGTAMEYLSLEIIFDVLKIRKLCGEVFTFNARVLKVHEKFGWVEEGILKCHRLNGGRYQDVVLIAMFVSHWDRIKREMKEKIFTEV